MIGVTWQQHRLQALIGGIILVLLALFLLITGLAVTSYYQANVAGCVGASQTCPSYVFDAFEQYVGSLQVQNILLVLPLLVGIFIGAPLLAREVEQGTYLLAWTQGVTRQRWLASKLILLAGATLGAFLLLDLLVTWWNSSLVAAVGPFFGFDITGVVPLI
nr:ABC transporter permease [Chloroflexota bacterium]